MSDKECCSCGNCISERCWIDYPEDDNCIYNSIEKHGAMTLEEVGKRLGISFVRVRQIEQAAMEKLRKRIMLENKEAFYKK